MCITIYTVQFSTNKHGTVQYITAHHSKTRYSTVQYSTVQYSTVQYSTPQHTTVRHSIVQYSTIQYSTVQNSITQYSTTQCSTTQYSTAYLTRGFRSVYSAPMRQLSERNTLQRVGMWRDGKLGCITDVLNMRSDESCYLRTDGRMDDIDDRKLFEMSPFQTKQNKKIYV
jgi:hypothetical protein